MYLDTYIAQHGKATAAFTEMQNRFVSDVIHPSGNWTLSCKSGCKMIQVTKICKFVKTFLISGVFSGISGFQFSDSGWVCLKGCSQIPWWPWCETSLPQFKELEKRNIMGYPDPYMNTERDTYQLTYWNRTHDMFRIHHLLPGNQL